MGSPESNAPEQRTPEEERAEQVARFKELVKTRHDQLVFWEERVNDLRGGKQVIEWADLEDDYSAKGHGNREVVTDEQAVEILRDHPNREKFFKSYRKVFTHPRPDNQTAMTQALDLPLKNEELGNPVSDDDIRRAQAAQLYYIAWSGAQLEALDRLEQMLDAGK